ncbi:MAG: Farnesyl diphosphate synthase [Pseudorhodoplanes sp.]|nr:Farnesyl diphosphate synthase [Pseudorhodoplanes sp.]
MLRPNPLKAARTPSCDGLSPGALSDALAVPCPMTERPDPALFPARLGAAAAATEELLATLLADRPEPGEIARPRRLIEAMRHAALAGGKRLRPFLVIESAALFSVPPQQAAMAGAALECVHCYSLVHDDLPAMDNDAMRRGRPTTHIAFDEATAILAGDSLLTLAFDILSRPQVHPDPAVRVALIGALARASGLGGMAGGQMLDLAAEGRFGKSVPDERRVVELQRMKTGALLRFACIAGAILGNASAHEHKALADYGEALGAAFQIADDLLDIEGDAAALGKATGKDAAAGKATLVGLLGVAPARARLADLVDRAQAALSVFGTRAACLQQAARYVAERER